MDSKIIMIIYFVIIQAGGGIVYDKIKGIRDLSGRKVSIYFK